MIGGPDLAITRATAGPYLAAKLATLDARLLEVKPRLEASDTDQEAVHDLRVGLRRARTVLEVGRPVLGRFHADEVRRALKTVMDATGALRDAEVMRELIGSLGVPHADVAAWLQGRMRLEARLRRALVRLVRGGTLDDGRKLLGALLAFRVDPSKDRRLTKFARRSVDRARRNVDRRRDPPLTDAAALHDLRIAYKRLRYTVETFEEALPSDLAALAQPAARFQSKLGDLHDVDVAVATARRARSLSPEGRAAVLAALDVERQARLAAYVKEAGGPAVASAAQAAGTASLRKISTR